MHAADEPEQAGPVVRIADVLELELGRPGGTPRSVFLRHARRVMATHAGGARQQGLLQGSLRSQLKVRPVGD